MRGKILQAACALAAAGFLWGCGGAQEEKGNVPGAAEGQTQGQLSRVEKEGKPQERTDPVKRSAKEKNKTVSILGDSISTYRDYNPEGYAVFYPDMQELELSETWWMRVIEELGLTLYVNGSSSGSLCAGNSTGTTDPMYAGNELRTGALAGPEGAIPDNIIVYMGTNDLLDDIPLGDNDGTRLVEEGEVEAFSDAYTLLLDKLEAKYPAAKIYCCTLLPIAIYGQDGNLEEVKNGKGLTTADYSGVIARIAANRGFSVVDLQNCGITLENIPEMTFDGVHPTAEGMRCIAEAVKRAFTDDI